jgi:Protein of unknown function (DUF3300)
MTAIPASRLRVALASFALFALVCAAPLSAQEGAQPPPPSALSAAQVAELVAPIALYPDALQGQVLTASTYPLEVEMAARWSKANPSVKGPALEEAMQQQPWDPSVKALAAVPQVLAMMSDKLEWTKGLGDAYLAQPDDIAAAVQQLRARADAAGNLKSSNEQQVRRGPAPPRIVGEPDLPDYYIIEPVDPDVIYVPIYDPYQVYGVWPYPTYRPFYWYPPGYVAVGVLAFGAPSQGDRAERSPVAARPLVLPEIAELIGSEFSISDQTRDLAGLRPPDRGRNRYEQRPPAGTWIRLVAHHHSSRRALAGWILVRCSSRRVLSWAAAGARANSSPSERLIDHPQDGVGRKLVQTAAVAVQVPLATELLARQARQRILHHPNVTAMLNGAGGVPRLG